VTTARPLPPRTAHPEGAPAVWTAPLFNPSGYATEARHLVLELLRRRHPIGVVPLDTQAGFGATLPAAERAALEEAVRSRRRLPADALGVLHSSPTTCALLHASWTGTGPVAFRTMFETARLPPGFVGDLARADEVWVPSRYVADSFLKSGVRTPIRIVPDGVDPFRFRPDGPRLLEAPQAGCVFLSVFEWTDRKGWDLLLRAWATAFDRRADVVLVIRSSLPVWLGAAPAGELERRLNRFLHGIGRSRRQVAPIVLLERELDPDDLPALYRSADVFVLPTRGEGFGLPFLEAMASGLPVVAPAIGGQADFLRNDTARLVAVDRLVPAPPTVDVPHYAGLPWAEVSLSDLVAALRELAADPTARVELGRRARAAAASHWSWEMVGAAVSEAVEALTSAPRERRGATTASRPLHLAPRLPDARATDRPAGSTEATASATRDIAIAHPEGPWHVRWVGEWVGDESLARVNAALVPRVRRLARAEASPTGGAPHRPIEVELVPPGSGDGPSVAGGAGLGRPEPSGSPPLESPSALVDSRPGGPTGGVAAPDRLAEVHHHWPPSWSSPAEGAWVLIQPWEFGGLPDSWVEAIADRVDEIWCPSSYVRDCYIRAGLPPERLVVVRNGVDLDLYRPAGPRYPLRTERTTRFLFLGGTIARKGIDVLLNAYRQAFGPADDVCLVVKAHGSDGAYRHNNLDHLVREAADDPTGPEIELVEGHLSSAEIAALYRSCDVLVHPYRGEGFGLPVAEAMASGLPVVVTAGGACDDFVDEAVGWRIPARPSPLFAADLGPSQSGYWWLEPDLPALVGTLRAVVADREERARRGAAARRRAETDLGWEEPAAIVLARLRELAHWQPLRLQPPCTLAYEPDRPEDLTEVVRAYAGRFPPAGRSHLLVWTAGMPTPLATAAAETGLAAGRPDGRAPRVTLIADQDRPEVRDRVRALADRILPPHPAEATRLLAELAADFRRSARLPKDDARGAA